MPSELSLIVAGRRYRGWKSIRVTSSIESIAGSFDLEVSDRWGEDGEVWPIAEEDPCQVAIDDDVVIDGYVTTRSLSISSTTRSLGYAGKDRAAELVECSAVIGSGGGTKWVHRNVSLLEFVRALAQPHGVSVSVQPGVALARVPVLTINPGDTPYEAMARAAGDIGVIVVSDGKGGLVITRTGKATAEPLVQGENVLAASVDYDAANRFYRYLISSQIPGTDEAFGAATSTIAQAVDAGVRRQSRVLLIRPDKGYSTADARRRADWEARTRAARAEQVSVTVLGWRQRSRALWMPNATSYVQIPAIGVRGTMLISQVERTVGPEGERTQLRLVRPDAFEPEPRAVVAPSSGAWKELAGGGR